MHVFFLLVLIVISSNNLFAECRAADIAVVDSGIDLNHPDFRGQLIPGYDFGDNDRIPQDDTVAQEEGSQVYSAYNGHGTNVAGIALGLYGNTPVAVANLSCPVRVMPLKINVSRCSLSQLANLDCIASTEAALAAVDYAISAPNIKVVNMSFGIREAAFAQGMILRLEAARKKGIFVVMAAGNDGLNLDRVIDMIAASRAPIKMCRRCRARSYTGGALRKELIKSYPNLILVANASGSYWQEFSNYGKQSVHLATQGENLYSTSVGSLSPSNEMSGTSQAAPRVSRALALLIAQYPRDSYLSTLNRLKGLLKFDNLDVVNRTIWKGYLP